MNPLRSRIRSAVRAQTAARRGETVGAPVWVPVVSVRPLPFDSERLARFSEPASHSLASKLVEVGLGAADFRKESSMTLRVVTKNENSQWTASRTFNNLRLFSKETVK